MCIWLSQEQIHKNTQTPREPNSNTQNTCFPSPPSIDSTPRETLTILSRRRRVADEAGAVRREANEAVQFASEEYVGGLTEPLGRWVQRGGVPRVQNRGNYYKLSEHRSVRCGPLRRQAATGVVRSATRISIGPPASSMSSTGSRESLRLDHAPVESPTVQERALATLANVGSILFLAWNPLGSLAASNLRQRISSSTNSSKEDLWTSKSVSPIEPLGRGSMLSTSDPSTFEQHYSTVHCRGSTTSSLRQSFAAWEPASTTLTSQLPPGTTDVSNNKVHPRGRCGTVDLSFEEVPPRPVLENIGLSLEMSQLVQRNSLTCVGRPGSTDLNVKAPSRRNSLSIPENMKYRNSSTGQTLSEIPLDSHAYRPRTLSESIFEEEVPESQSDSNATEMGCVHQTSQNTLQASSWRRFRQRRSISLGGSFRSTSTRFTSVRSSIRRSLHHKVAPEPALSQ